RERGTDLCGDLVQRIVPRRDRRDNAYRLMVDQRVTDLFLQDELQKALSRDPQVDDGKPRLYAQCSSVHRTDVLADDLCDLLLTALECVGQETEPPPALLGRGRAPPRQRRASRGNGGIAIRLIAIWDR